MTRTRVYILDWLRGIAVCGMVMHHALFAYEQVASLFGFGAEGWVFDFLDTRTFWVLQEIFVGLFLLISGICTAYSRSVLRRGLIVSGAAIAITLVTGVLLPAVGVFGLEIWFGILHMFGASMLLYGLFTCKKRWVPVVTGIALFCFWLAVINCAGMEWAENAKILVGILPPGFYSADYYPLIPYFFLYLAGAFLGPAVKEGKMPGWFYTARFKPLEWIGRNSLWIYIAHQPLLFGLFALIFYLK